MRTWIFAILVAAFVAACPKPTPGPTPPGPAPDPSDPCVTEPDGTCASDPCDALPPTEECPFSATHGTCARMCRHGKILGCTWAEPTPSGATCVAVCENIRAKKKIPINLSCRATARTCDDADRCER